MKKTNAFIVFLFCLLAIGACKKKGNDGPTPGPTPTPTPSPVDPAVANTIGFFMNDWVPRNFTVPAYTDTTIPTAQPGVFVNIDAADIVTKVSPSLFGQNANIWMTQMVTEPALINHLTNLKPNII